MNRPHSIGWLRGVLVCSNSFSLKMMYMGMKMGIENWDEMCQYGYIIFFIHFENLVYGVVS